MSYEPSHKDKLAEALLRYTPSTLNYEVIPPPPSTQLRHSSDTNASHDSYISEFVPSIAIVTRAQAEAAGYGLLSSSQLPDGYLAPSPPRTAGGAGPSNGDYYIATSSGNLGVSGVSLGENEGRNAARRLADRLAQDMHLNRDFNKDYQVLMEAIETSSDDLALLTELRLLTKEFLDTAQSVGCIIIDELFEPSKTIPPVDIGGIAGGVKYVYRNILYKICLDTQLDEHRGWMHGGDKPSHEKAMKTGAHELRGLMHYSSLRVSGLHFPLMLVMDYKGFRLVAESLLPINKETIRYGSSDGGESVHANGELLCQMMKTVGQQLHLAQHLVKDKLLYGPGDQEVHQGLDGRFYCIDLARVFPCEPAKHHLTPTAAANASTGRARASTPSLTVSGASPSPIRAPMSANKSPAQSAPLIPTFDEPRSIFYKFFRPEFVLSYKKPLACDCFTAWGKNDPAFQQLNKDVVDAFLHLRSLIIPKFASSLDKQVDALPHLTVAWEWWVTAKPLEAMHEMGINIRHLGLVRIQCVNEFARKMLLNEMIARVLKNMIRKRLREEAQLLTRLSQEQVKDIVIAFYNWVLGLGPSPLLQKRQISSPRKGGQLINPTPLHMSGPVFTLEKSSDSISSTSSSETSSPFQSSSTVPRGFGPIATSHILTGFGPVSPPGDHLVGKAQSTSTPINILASSPPVGGTVPPILASPPFADSSSPPSSSPVINWSSDSASSPQVPMGSKPLAQSSNDLGPSFPDDIFLQQFYFQFESPLLRDEAKDPFKTIKMHVDRTLLFSRLNQMLGIEMDSEAAKELQHTSSYEFVHCDLSSMTPKVRFMNLVDEAEGLALFITAKQKKQDQRKRLLKLATSKFQASCASLPHNFRGLFYWGRSLYEEAKMMSGDRQERIKIFEFSLSKLELVTKLRAGHFKSWAIQVRIWFKLFETPEYLERIGDHHVTDLIGEDFSFLTDNLVNACTRLMRLNLFWVDKLLRKARTIFSQAQSNRAEPTSLLKIVQSICLAIQEVCGPMLEAYPSVPLPPDAIQIKLPRIHVESLLLCARSLQLRSVFATARVMASKPVQTSQSSHQMGINQDELHSKRLKFQIAEQFTAALETKYQEDAPYLDRLLIESLPEIIPLIKSSKSLAGAFRERCRQIVEVRLSLSNSSANLANSSSAQIIKSKSSIADLPGAVNPNRLSGTLPALGSAKNASSPQLPAGSSAASTSPSATDTTALLASSSQGLSATPPAQPSASTGFAAPNLIPSDPLSTFIDLALPFVGPKLTTIDLSGSKNFPTDVLSKLFFRASRTLTYLDISELSGASETWLQSATAILEQLKHLKVRELRITDETALALCIHHGHNLITLDISSNRLTNYGLYRMAKELKCLQVLDLSGNVALGLAHPKGSSKTSDFEDAMSLLRPSLTSLSMLECYQLSNQSLWDIASKLRNLEHLSLASKQISDQYLMKLEVLFRNLKSLELRGLSNTDPPFVHLLSHLGPECRSLSLRACMGITDESIQVLEHCPNLQVLNLGLCLLVQGKCFESLATQLHALVELDLSGLSIHPATLSQFVMAQPNLESLIIPNLTIPLSDSILIEALSHSPRLRELNVASSQQLTIRFLDALVQLSPPLQALILADCHGMRGDLARPLLRFKTLTYLNIRYAHPPGEHPSHHSDRLLHISTLLSCQNCGSARGSTKKKKSAILETEIAQKLKAMS